MKWSNLTVRYMYRGLFTKQLEVQMHAQDTYKPPRVGLVRRGRQQSPEFSMLALSPFHLVDQVSSREQSNVLGKKITSITDENSIYRKVNLSAATV